MGKRAAYIGISYPLLYDYKHQADKTINDLWDSPNPIIESPLGLLVFYDEILFLCKSLCPNNMRDLPYVKFVDELYPDFYLKEIEESARRSQGAITTNPKITYSKVVKSLNVQGWGRIDNHTHALKIGDVILSGNSDEYHFLFDLYVFQALQNLYKNDIELIANSKYPLEIFGGGAKAELIDRIIIQGIPNYLSFSGPYHECMEELRENKYIKDFRRWIIETHKNIQRPEITEMCNAVEQSIKEVQEDIFMRYLDDHSGYSFSRSTASTILKTAAGIACTPVSVIDAFANCLEGGQDFLEAKSLRWQGFVIEARNLLKKGIDL